MAIAQYSMATAAQFVGRELGASDWVTVDQDRINFGIRLNDGHHIELIVANDPDDAAWPSRAEAVLIVARFERAACGSKLIEVRRAGGWTLA